MISCRRFGRASWTPGFVNPEACKTGGSGTVLLTDTEITVLVVDDHSLTAELASAWLNHEAGFRTAHAESVEDALGAIRQNGSFHVLLLDLDMPGMNGVEGVERMVSANLPGAVVLFSGQAQAEGALRAIELGARGFIPKTLPLKSLANAVRFVALGETYLPHSIAALMRSPGRKGRKSGVLTTVELDVVKGIVRGMTNRAIGEELGLTEVTVKAHVRSICSKLSVSNRTQVALTAVSRGIA